MAQNISKIGDWWISSSTFRAEAPHHPLSNRGRSLFRVNWARSMPKRITLDGRAFVRAKNASGRASALRLGGIHPHRGKTGPPEAGKLGAFSSGRPRTSTKKAGDGSLSVRFVGRRKFTSQSIGPRFSAVGMVPRIGSWDRHGDGFFRFRPKAR